MVAPVVAGAAVVAKLAYKPAMKLAKSLAKKYWGKGADKKAIVKEVREKGVLEKFNSFKLKLKPKVDKPTKRPFEKKSHEKQTKELESYAKRKKLDVEGKSSQEAAEMAIQYQKANRPYTPSGSQSSGTMEELRKFRGLTKYVKKRKGGSVKKYAKGGGVRKANYK
jgi:hypothetical protein